MTDADKDFLKKLLSTPGPSSFESKPARVWRDQAEHYGAKLRSDAYGNSFATFGGEKPRVMLAGHIDEIGLMISYIDDKGLLYFSGIGGWDAQQLVGQRVRILGYKNELLGVVGRKPVHLLKPDDRNKASKLEDMWLDIGAKSADEAREHVRVGDVAVIEQPYLELLNERVVSKAIDNRIGAYIVLEAARRANEKSPKAQLVAVATVQEEIGHIGAGVAAYGLEPDLAIAVDVTHATDVPGVSKQENGDVPFGSGATLTVGSTVHRGLFNRLVETAEASGIPYAIEAAPRRTFTDGDQIAATRGSVPTVVVSIPNRYMHSPNEMIDLADLEHVIDLIATFVGGLDEKVVLEQP